MTSRVPISFICVSMTVWKPFGVDLNFILENHPRDVFDRMAGGHEFECSEMSTSEYVCRCSAEKLDFVAIPVFPSRAFKHGFIAVNSNTVKSPTDLNGKQNGVQLQTMTAAVWIRSLLKQSSVDLDTVTWIEGSTVSPKPHGKPSAIPPLKPISITNNKSGKCLSQALRFSKKAKSMQPLEPIYPHVPQSSTCEANYFLISKMQRRNTTNRRGSCPSCTLLS